MNAASDAPPKKSVNIGLNAASHDDGAAIRNPVYEVEHVSSSEIGYVPVTPNRQHVLLYDARDLSN